MFGKPCVLKYMRALWDMDFNLYVMPAAESNQLIRYYFNLGLNYDEIIVNKIDGAIPFSDTSTLLTCIRLYF